MPTSRPSSKMVIFKQYIPNNHKHFSKRMSTMLHHLWHESILREKQTVHGTTLESNACLWQNWSRKWMDVVKNCKWTSSFPPWPTWWIDREKKKTDVGLSHQTGRVYPKPQENETEMVIWQKYCGGIRETFTCWWISMVHQQKVISAMNKGMQ